MINSKALRTKLKSRIDNLSEERLKDVSIFLESIEVKSNKDNILPYSGSWKDIDNDIFDELTSNLEERRKNNRRRFIK